MADQTSEIPDARLDCLSEENATLKMQLEQRKEEIDKLRSTIDELREELLSKEMTLEEQQKRSNELAACVEPRTNADASGGDSQDVNETAHSEKDSEKDSEIARLKKRNLKLERDLRSLKEKYNNQSKELTKKANLPTIEKTLKEIERWEVQSSNLKASLQGMIHDLKQDTKSNARSEPRHGAKTESKVETKAGARADEKTEQQTLTMSRELRQEFHEDQNSGASRAVEVEIWTPGEVETEWESLELRSGERLWPDFITNLTYLEEEMKAGPVAVIQWGEFFVEQERVVKSLQVLNPSSQVSEFSTTAGEVMAGDKSTHSFRHFLHPQEPVLFCPGQISVLTVMTRCRVLRQQPSARRYQLVDTSLESIFDPHALVLIFGLHLRNNDTRQDTLFVQLNGRRFCESKTGRMFDSEAEVYAGHDRADSKFRWSCLMIVIRHGDRVPYCKVPDDTPVTAFTRFGVAAYVDRGRVYARYPAAGGTAREGTWTMKKAIDAFDLQLMQAMRG